MEIFELYSIYVINAINHKYIHTDITLYSYSNIGVFLWYASSYVCSNWHSPMPLAFLGSMSTRHFSARICENSKIHVNIVK